MFLRYVVEDKMCISVTKKYYFNNFDDLIKLNNLFIYLLHRVVATGNEL